MELIRKGYRIKLIVVGLIIIKFDKNIKFKLKFTKGIIGGMVYPESKDINDNIMFDLVVNDGISIFLVDPCCHYACAS